MQDQKEVPQPQGLETKEVGRRRVTPGDVVHEIGTPSKSMTVDRVTDSGVECSWFEGDELKTGTFAEGGLRGQQSVATAQHGSSYEAKDAARAEGRPQSNVPRGVAHYALALPAPGTILSWIDRISVLAHEANRIWQLLSGDPNPSPTWASAPEEQKDSTREGILKIASGEVTTPEQAHRSWLAHKQAAGWMHGPVKNGDAKTHPCMVPYEELPSDQRAKDAIFFGLVTNLLAASDGEVR